MGCALAVLCIAEVNNAHTCHVVLEMLYEGMLTKDSKRPSL